LKRSGYWYPDWRNKIIDHLSHITMLFWNQMTVGIKGDAHFWLIPNAIYQASNYGVKVGMALPSGNVSVKIIDICG
jgi:hypothetical protein